MTAVALRHQVLGRAAKRRGARRTVKPHGQAAVVAPAVLTTEGECSRTLKLCCHEDSGLEIPAAAQNLTSGTAASRRIGVAAGKTGQRVLASRPDAAQVCRTPTLLARQKPNALRRSGTPSGQFALPRLKGPLYIPRREALRCFAVEARRSLQRQVLAELL